MATKSVSIEPVVKTVTVACTPEVAFQYFTADFGMWWPAATHSVVAHASQFKDKPTTVIFEPRVSGRIFERTRAGEEHSWGSVLVWQPPTRGKPATVTTKDGREYSLPPTPIHTKQKVISGAVRRTTVGCPPAIATSSALISAVSS